MVIFIFRKSSQKSLRVDNRISFSFDHKKIRDIQFLSFVYWRNTSLIISHVQWLRSLHYGFLMYDEWIFRCFAKSGSLHFYTTREMFDLVFDSIIRFSFEKSAPETNPLRLLTWTIFPLHSLTVLDYHICCTSNARVMDTITDMILNHGKCPSHWFTATLIRRRFSVKRGRQTIFFSGQLKLQYLPNALYSKRISIEESLHVTILGGGRILVWYRWWFDVFL